MLSHATQQLLQEQARKICRKFKLTKVYFAHVLQKRKHYLAGYGEESFSPTSHMPLNESIMLFWQGNLHPEEQDLIKKRLHDIALFVLAELT